MAKRLRARKRLSINDVNEGHSLDIEGKIVQVSPDMKKAKNSDSYYFDGIISDSKRSLRFVGFDAQKRGTIQSYYEDHKPIVIANCTARPSKVYDINNLYYILCIMNFHTFTF